jgi:hypothetical protein
MVMRGIVEPLIEKDPPTRSNIIFGPFTVRVFSDVN